MKSSAQSKFGHLWGSAMAFERTVAPPSSNSTNGDEAEKRPQLRSSRRPQHRISTPAGLALGFRLCGTACRFGSRQCSGRENYAHIQLVPRPLCCVLH